MKSPKGKYSFNNNIFCYYHPKFDNIYCPKDKNEAVAQYKVIWEVVDMAARDYHGNIESPLTDDEWDYWYETLKFIERVHEKIWLDANI